MPLREYIPKTETVSFPGGSFNVRAISLPDVAIIVDVHEYAISLIADKIRNRKEMFESGDEAMVHEAVVELASELVREAPVLVANLIAICADERDSMEQASKLPITVQIEAMMKIVGLTFTDLAAIKKLAADVMKLVRGMIPTATARRKKA